jgi:hypothetical protein
LVSLHVRLAAQRHGGGRALVAALALNLHLQEIAYGWSTILALLP